jgi:hypothetical protein
LMKWFRWDDEKTTARYSALGWKEQAQEFPKSPPKILPA